MPITINGSGTLTGLSAGGLPDSSITSDDIASAAVTPAKLSQPLTLATAQNTTSGTSIDFTGIPSWVRRITILFADVSTNGTTNPMVQLGTSSGIDATGYISTVSNIFSGGSPQTTSNTTGFLIHNGMNSSVVLHGTATLHMLSSNLWVFSGNLITSDAARSELSGGRKTLSGTLDRIRLTTVNGTDTFDAGSVNIMYEG